MNKEEIYKFGDFVITYDKGVNNDRSCLIISKVDKINIYVLGELYDESADIINTIINNLQQENKKYKEVINKATQDLQEIIDNVNDKTIISLGHFISRLEVIQDELNGSNDILKEV